MYRITLNSRKYIYASIHNVPNQKLINNKKDEHKKDEHKKYEHKKDEHKKYEHKKIERQKTIQEFVNNYHPYLY